MAAVAVPQAKVYLKDMKSTDDDEKRPQANSAKRYRIGVNILGLEEDLNPRAPIKTSLFIVKGNPLITSPTPLPCFASGVGSVMIDLRDGEDIGEFSLQVLLNDLSAHFALPLDDILELVSSSEGIERSITVWDTQTGSMRTSCVVKITVERQQPLSVAEVAEIRRRQWGISPAADEPDEIDIPEAPQPIETIISQEKPAESTDFLAQLSQRANDLLATARSYAGPLEETKEEKLIALEQQPTQRRRRNNAMNFAINNSDDIINTVIPE